MVALKDGFGTGVGVGVGFGFCAAFTVTLQLNFFVFAFAVITAVPFFTAVIFPLESTRAILGLEEEYFTCSVQFWCSADRHTSKCHRKNKADQQHKTQQIFFLFHSDFPLSGKTYIYVIYCFNHILEEIPYKNTSTYDSILVNMIVYILSSPIPGLIVRKQK